MYRIFLSLIVLVVPAVDLLAQTSPIQATSASGISWIRDFATPSSEQKNGPENQLNWDPRFRALLQSSFPQRQFFWRDRGHFLDLPSLIQSFIEVPGKVLLDQGRYVTVDGCVPRDCGNRGLVWIDTVAEKGAPVIFAATNYIGGSAGRDGDVHLWLFSSALLDWQKMPSQFLSSLTRWWNQPARTIALVTLVQPSSEMVDLSPSVFAFKQSTPVTSKPTVSVSAGVAEGLLLRKVDPVQPAGMHIEGTVIVQTTIDEDGRIERVRALSGTAALQGAALDAVKQWLYRPYLLNNVPAEVQTTITVKFDN